MKRLLGTMALVLLIAGSGLADDQHRYGLISVQKIQGDVSVRHGVAEEWSSVKAGDSLKPDDTMKTGPGGTAVIAAPAEGSAVKILKLPPDVIVDLSDVRTLTPEELMLKLTMEKVRASSYEWKNNELNIPTTTVVHGTDQSPRTPVSADEISVGRLQLNGSRVLFDNGFYSTSALRAMDVLRRYPALAAEVDNRVLLAEALEKANLRGEAISEYTSVLQMESAGNETKARVRKRIEELRVRGEG
ncbi:MAG: hypothetical protein OEM41_09905 [Ignavibacteria bacterium]|nr:hypothetical protein [Ignavibacteria bacterium]